MSASTDTTTGRAPKTASGRRRRTAEPAEQDVAAVVAEATADVSRLDGPTSGELAASSAVHDALEPEGAHHGYSSNKTAHLKRMARIEGQVRGIAQMIDGDRYCIDVLTQVSAVTKALQAVSLALLEEHMAHCVANAVAAGPDEGAAKLKEAHEAIARLVRS